MPRPLVSLIAAVARDGGIGRANTLLVHLPEDLAHFKRTTLGAPIVMGRRTWESIGRPLPGRRNVVVSRDPTLKTPGAESALSFGATLDLLADATKIFVIGGAELYASALSQADELVLTEIDATFDADTFFPHWNRAEFELAERRMANGRHDPDFSFATYRRTGRS